MREIPLSQGKVALIDDEDFERVSQYKWHVHKTRSGKLYVEGQVNGRQIPLHRFIMDTPPDMEVDHIDGNGLNCQKYNMRVVTHADNSKNAKKRSDNSSGYKGVSYNKGRRKYRATIESDGVTHFLGYFDEAEEAARVYDAAACQYHGEFANLNFPNEWKWDAEKHEWQAEV